MGPSKGPEAGGTKQAAASLTCTAMPSHPCPPCQSLPSTLLPSCPPPLQPALSLQLCPSADNLPSRLSLRPEATACWTAARASLNLTKQNSSSSLLGIAPSESPPTVAHWSAIVGLLCPRTPCTPCAASPAYSTSFCCCIFAHALSCRRVLFPSIPQTLVQTPLASGSLSVFPS